MRASYLLQQKGKAEGCHVRFRQNCKRPSEWELSLLPRHTCHCALSHLPLETSGLWPAKAEGHFVLLEAPLGQACHLSAPQVHLPAAREECAQAGLPRSSGDRPPARGELASEPHACIFRTPTGLSEAGLTSEVTSFFCCKGNVDLSQARM